MSYIRDMSPIDSLATEYRATRRRRGLTQAALAQRAGLSRAKIIQIEKGETGVSIGAYAAVATALGAALAITPLQRPTLEETRELFADDD
jgi:HTH-type transcriptional regulator / antitoxin HipB